MKNIVITLLLSIFVFSCSKSKKEEKYLPTSTGGMNEVMIIMPKSWYDNDTFKGTLSEYIETAQYGLPQPEKLLDITYQIDQFHTDKSSFEKVKLYFKPFKGESYFTYKRNQFAKPQVIMEIGASSSLEALDEFIRNEQVIRALSHQVNRFKQQRIHSDKGLLDIQEDPALVANNVKIDIPSYMRKATVEEKYNTTYSWYKKETAVSISNLFVTSIDLPKEVNKNTILSVRDSLCKLYFTGTKEGDYMQSHTKIYPPIVTPLTHKGKKGFEIRGMWEMSTSFMAGPYVGLAVVDSVQKKLLYAEGFIYAPNEKKRNRLFQMEAAIYSLDSAK